MCGREEQGPQQCCRAGRQVWQQSHLRELLGLLFSRGRTDIVGIPVADTVLLTPGGEASCFCCYDEREGLRWLPRKSSNLSHARFKRMMMTRLLEKKEALFRRDEEAGEEAQRRVREKVEEARVTTRELFLVRDTDGNKYLVSQYQFVEMFKLSTSNQYIAAGIEFVQTAPVTRQSLHKVERVHYQVSCCEQALLGQAQEQVIRELEGRRILAPDCSGQALIAFLTYKTVAYIELFNPLRVVQLLAEWAVNDLGEWLLSDAIALQTEARPQLICREKIYSSEAAAALIGGLKDNQRQIRRGQLYENLNARFEKVASEFCLAIRTAFKHAERDIVLPEDNLRSDEAFGLLNTQAQASLTDILRGARPEQED